MPGKCAVYCYTGLDGIASAAILLRMLKIKQYSYKIEFLDYSNAGQVFDEMAELRETLIFILDFPPHEVPDLKNRVKKVERNYNKIIYWNSHIKSPDDVKQFAAEHSKFTDFDEGRCSAYMTSERFTPKDKGAFDLRAIAHDQEFWVRQDERSGKLADIIASGYNKKELVESLARGIVWSERFEQLRQEYIVKKEKASQDLVKSIIVHYYSPYNFGFAFASSLLSTADAGQKVLEDKKIDISVVIYKDGKLSFRRSELAQIDLREVAAIFNGGGHAYAAGGKLPEDVTLPVNSIDRFKFAVEHLNKILREKLKN